MMRRGLVMGVTLGLGFTGIAVAGPAEPAEEKVCFEMPPEGFRNYSGTSENKVRDEALARAKTTAWTEMERSICSGSSTERCEASKRHAGITKETYDEPTRLACAMYQINAEQLDSLKRDLEVFTAQLIELAGSFLAGANSEKSVWFTGPSWAGASCSGGAEGKSIATVVASAFRKRGFRVQRDGQEIQLSLSPMPPNVMLIAEGQQGNDFLSQNLTFPRDLFALKESGDACGLKKLKAEGLDVVLAPSHKQRVRIDTGLANGVTCEGHKYVPHLRAPQPSRAVLLSVEPDGTTFLVWPMDGNTSVSGSLSLGEWVAVNSVSGDEQLMVAAFSESASPPLPVQSPCKMSRSDISKVLHGAETVAASSYRVLSGGVEGCNYTPASIELKEQANWFRKTIQPCRFSDN